MSIIAINALIKHTNVYACTGSSMVFIAANLFTVAPVLILHDQFTLNCCNHVTFLCTGTYWDMEQF